jgi:hypothetical protein
MRKLRQTALFLTAFCLISCASYRGVPVYGASSAVSPRDLDSVVQATQKGTNRPDQLYAFRVISRDEVWLYAYPYGHVFYESYWIVKRINGRWRCDEVSWVVHLHS